MSEPHNCLEASLIICTRNRPRLLEDCVSSVLAGDHMPAELLIVDQSDLANSHLAQMQTDRPCVIRYHWRVQIGLSRSINFAVREAANEVLVFTNDDVEVTPSWFGSIVRALGEAGPKAIVTGQVRPKEPEQAGAFVPPLSVNSKQVRHSGRLDRDVLYGANMAMLRSVVSDVGWFDERLGPGTRFPAAEDSDFAFRALDAGYEVIYEPNAAVLHRAWRPETQRIRLRWAYGVGRGAFYAKHLSSSDPHMRRRLRHDVSVHIAAVPGLLRADWREAAGNLALASGLVFGAIRWLYF